MAAIHNLAVILKNPQSEAEFLLVKQTRPLTFGDDEYDSYVDSDLWDLPSTQLNLLEAESESQTVVEGAERCSEKINLGKFDISSAFHQVLNHVGLVATAGGEWTFWKYVEEAEFGPGLPVHTVFISGQLVCWDQNLQGQCKWMSVQRCLSWLLEVKPGSDRVGPLAVVGLINDSMQPADQKLPPIIPYQEYPPGVKIVPMGSRTAKPFCTTNLIVFAPENVSNKSEKNSFVAYGDALIVDPGCRSAFHEELQKIVAALPRKLVVFVTHHHRDHVDGLSIIQKSNPDATLLAHDNTMRRIGKGDWSLGYTSISGAEEICIGGQRLSVIFAPGHTDGHMALLHVRTHSLIVGDHCVGQGSAVLDVTSGGNMDQYFRTTYKFMELSPHALIPMHGRVNLWPKHMLCGYLKNRRSRETSVLKAIENGAETLFDIVADVYSEVDRRLWIPAASNVRLHVDHLAQQDRLPKGFSLETFNCSLTALAAKLNYQKLVEWGRATMMDAERRLLANALLDFSNERFVLLSETCIPLFNFTTIYKYLINSNHSFVGSFDDPRPMGRGRYNKRMWPTISLSDWRKGNQWFEVCREMAIEIVSDVKYYPIFESHCRPPCYMDEHYLATLVTKTSSDMNSNRSITWVDWSRGGSHPTRFVRKDVSEVFLNRLRHGLNCTYNGSTTTICFLFARKFEPNTLEPLLRVAPTLLGFNP